MRSVILLLAALFAQLAAAHFQINYPPWRNNSFNAPFSQTVYPCAGVPTTSGTNRTDWPLDGGSLSIDFHHPFTYVFINLGVGFNTTNFNVSLSPLPLNETGAGNLCIPKLQIPASANIVDGQQATLQIATVGPEGEGLYNCADITFRANATLLPSSQCVNDTGMSISVINQEVNGSTSTSSGSSSGTSSSPAASSSKSSGAQTSAGGFGWSLVFVTALAVGLSALL